MAMLNNQMVSFVGGCIYPDFQRCFAATFQVLPGTWTPATTPSRLLPARVPPVDQLGAFLSHGDPKVTRGFQYQKNLTLDDLGVPS